MTASEIFAWIHLILGIAAMYISMVYLTRSEKFTAKELGEVYPKHKTILRRFLPLYLGWMVLAFIIFPAISGYAVYSLGNLFASIGLFLGLYALKTGVCAVPSSNTYRIQFAVGEVAYRAGRLQTIWSLAVLALAFLWNFAQSIL
jgi:hypothetical protein